MYQHHVCIATEYVGARQYRPLLVGEKEMASFLLPVASSTLVAGRLSTTQETHVSQVKRVPKTLVRSWAWSRTRTMCRSSSIGKRQSRPRGSCVLHRNGLFRDYAG